MLVVIYSIHHYHGYLMHKSSLLFTSVLFLFFRQINALVYHVYAMIMYLGLCLKEPILEQCVSKFLKHCQRYCMSLYDCTPKLQFYSQAFRTVQQDSRYHGIQADHGYFMPSIFHRTTKRFKVFDITLMSTLHGGLSNSTVH